MVKQGTAISSLSQHVPIKLSIHILACQPLDFFFHMCKSRMCQTDSEKKKNKMFPLVQMIMDFTLIWNLVELSQ